MKRSILAVVGGGVLVGLAFCVSQHKTQPVSPAEPVAEAALGPAGDESQAVEPVAARPEQPAQPVETPNIARPISRPDRGRDGPKATPPSEPDWRVSRIRLSS